MTPVENSVSELAGRLLANAGNNENFIVEAMASGGNNRIFKVTAGGSKYVMKCYFRHERDTRDRLKAEFLFSKFLWERGIHCIAMPVSFDADFYAGIYSFVEGRKPLPEDIGEKEVAQALQFFIAVNNHRTDTGAYELPNASEACFSVEDHVEIIDKRLEMLRNMEMRDELDAEARRFIEHELYPRWLEIKSRIVPAAAAVGIHCDRLLSSEERVLSPSDFGFHNAVIADNGTIYFLDFEYAGWDDPAKMICDFFCQPALPVPMDYWDSFSEGVAECVSDKEAVRARAHILFPLYKIKWCCIVLNHFLPLGRERKQFAGQGPDAQKRAQLNKAMSLLASIKTMLLKGVLS